MGLFSSSKTNVTNTTQNTADSYNTTMSKNTISADSGNTVVNLGGSSAATAGLAKYLPIVALVCFGLAAILLLTGGKKPWEK